MTNWMRVLARRMPQGEGVVASVGAVGTLTLGLAIAASAWWIVRVQQRAHAAAESERLAISADLLGRSVPELLAAGDLAGARRLIAEAVANHHLGGCRVVLGDGTVLIDSDFSRSQGKAAALPETFPPLKNAAEPQPGVLTSTLNVPGRGPALLSMGAGQPAPLLSDWESRVGVGLIALVGFGGLLVSCRLMRSRLRALSAIREALAAAERGERSPDALRVGERLGAEATAWNRLIAEREQLRLKAEGAAAGERLSARTGRESDLSSGFDALWHGVLFVDEGLKVRYCNGAAAVLLGAKRDQLLGSAIATWMPEPAVAEAIGNVVAGRARGKSTVEVRRPGESAAGPRLDDGSDRRGKAAPTAAAPVVLRFSVRPMRREDSASVIVVIEDVTQQRVADDARNAFVGQAAHELRTPLTNIRLYVEQLIEDGDSDAGARAKSINVISQESRRLERIVSDMLSVAEIEAGSMKLHRGDCRCETLFEELRRDYEAMAAAKQIELTFDLPPKLPVLQADRDKVVMALHNLLGNAIKYTPVGGQVTVRARTTDAAFEVEVVDNGIGIREEEHELVFERFYRAKDKRISGITGSGIGLALAREVVRLHGGDITLRSQIDKGSTFTLSLPFRAQAA